MKTELQVRPLMSPHRPSNTEPNFVEGGHLLRDAFELSLSPPHEPGNALII